MNCPYCNKYAPDNNYKCPNCGKILKDSIDPLDSQRKSVKKHGLNPTHFILIVIVLGLVLMGYFINQQKVKKGKENIGKKTAAYTEAPVKSNETRTGTNRDTFDEQQNENIPTFSHQPGEEINIEDFVQKGKTTIFDFYSPYCGPCLRTSPLLERLDSKRNDIVVLKVDINRESVRGIDWRSPVARQYNIRVVPYFMIYDASGSHILEGNVAGQRVYQLLYEEGIR